jgi:hypothetical protein
MSKKVKIPKKLAGVKIPKTLRKGPVGHFVNSPAGQLLIAEAIAVGIAALAARRTATGERAGAVLAHRAADFGAQTRESMLDGSHRLAAAIRSGLAAFRQSLDEESGSDAAVDGAPVSRTADEDVSSKKRPASSATTAGASAH